MQDAPLVTLAPGDTLFNEGDPGETAFFIESGMIEVLRDLDGRTVSLAKLGAGELLGEMSLIDRQPRSATVVAVEGTTLRSISRDYYEQHYRDANPLIRLILRALLHRHRTSVGDVDDSGPSDTMQMDRDQLMARLRLEQELRTALKQEEYVLHFQPLVDVARGRTAGYEALLRWNSPTRGMVPPGQFIPVAEESDLIVDVGKWVLDQGCAALGRFREAQQAAGVDGPLFMTLNVSGRQFESGLLEEHVAGALSVDTRGGGLKLEITESLLMKDVRSGVALVRKLRELGAKLAVDDFGTGYSSLNYLHQLEANSLKVDRSFVKDLDEDPSGARVLRAINGLADGFRLDTVVEGVETATQRDVIREIGFDYIQGFFYSKPLPEADALKLVDRNWHVAEQSA